MPAWLNFILTIIYVVWLFAVLGLLWKIWRNGVERAQKVEQALIEAALICAHSTQRAADAAHILAEYQTTEEQPNK